MIRKFLLWRRSRELNRIEERIAGLEAKIAFWEGKEAVGIGGLHPLYVGRIGSWIQELAELKVRAARLRRILSQPGE